MALYMTNINFEADEGDIKKFFEYHRSPAKKVVLKRDRETGESRGFAFVYLEEIEDEEAVIDRLNEREKFMGRTVVLRISKTG